MRYLPSWRFITSVVWIFTKSFWGGGQEADGVGMGRGSCNVCEGWVPSRRQVNGSQVGTDPCHTWPGGTSPTLCLSSLCLSHLPALESPCIRTDICSCRRLVSHLLASFPVTVTGPRDNILPCLSVPVDVPLPHYWMDAKSSPSCSEIFRAAGFNPPPCLNLLLH